MIERLFLPPLCLLEKLYSRGTRCRLLLWAGGMALLALALQLADFVWVPYLLLAPIVLAYAVTSALTWPQRSKFILLGSALAMFGVGRMLWFLWPDYLTQYVSFLDLGHFALIANALFAYLFNTPAGQALTRKRPPSEDKEKPDA